MNETTLFHYLTGNATAEEKQQIHAWLQASESNRAYLSELRAIWQARRPAHSERKEKQIQESLDRLNRRIDSLSLPQTPSYPKKSLRLRWAAAAAVFLLLAGLSYSLFLSHQRAGLDSGEWITYTQAAGQHEAACFFLPDSSQVWLDQASTLKYPAHFTGDMREVSLEGTAFFEVKKDSRHPFIVRTPGCAVKVLGTAFSVRSTRPDEPAETILMNGSVQVLAPSGRPVARLQPGQQAVYSPVDQTVEIRAVDAEALTSWRMGLITLSNVPAAEIVDTLEALYAIRIYMDTSVLQGRLYNFTFKRANTPQTTLRQFSYITGAPAYLQAAEEKSDLPRKKK